MPLAYGVLLRDRQVSQLTALSHPDEALSKLWQHLPCMFAGQGPYWETQRILAWLQGRVKFLNRHSWDEPRLIIGNSQCGQGNDFPEDSGPHLAGKAGSLEPQQGQNVSHDYGFC